ncbi:MAG: ATP-binding protein [Deltaproteobacteria bacterium]|nr:ATP-binding protein [Deltaproteobacteria bacterium]
METIIEQLIADFHERALPPLTRRHVKLPWLPGKIDTLIGMRRSGKTWFLFQVISHLLAKKVPKESILYLNLEDERLLPMEASDLHLITDVYFRRYPHLRDMSCTFFFDEIQNISGWERFVRRVLDTEKVHICITGSSARLLSREIATSLRGRSIATEIFPFSFLEYLDHNGIDIEGNKRPGAKKRALIENRFRSYLLKGGFPEVQGMEDEYRIRILQDYLNVVILRDLVERYRISSTVPLRYMIRHIINAPASLFSVNKFYNDLKSQGISCGKNTLHEYLDYLSDAYLFFQVFLHTGSERARMVNPRKIYVIDTGLINACSRNTRPEWGHLLENFVFMELRRRHEAIEYYKTASGREVDFIVTDRQRRKSLIQVAAEIDTPATRSRELMALEETMKETGISEGVVVTLNHEKHLNTEAGHIHIMPAWLWAIRS